MIVQYFSKEETQLKQNLICRYNETVKSIFVIAESMYVTTSKIEKKTKNKLSIIIGGNQMQIFYCKHKHLNVNRKLLCSNCLHG